MVNSILGACRWHAVVLLVGTRHGERVRRQKGVHRRGIVFVGGDEAKEGYSITHASEANNGGTEYVGGW